MTKRAITNLDENQVSGGLLQSKITCYFSNSRSTTTKTTLTSKNTPSKIKMKVSRKRNHTKNANVRISNGSSIGSDDLSQNRYSTIGIGKRNLSVQIFSEDEDEDQSQSEIETKVSVKKELSSMTEVCINKPTPSTSCQRDLEGSEDIILVLDSDDSGEASPNKKPKISNKVAVSSPNKSTSASPQKKTTKTKDNAELNYNNINVMKDFYLKIAKNPNWKELYLNVELEMLDTFFKMGMKCQYVCMKLFTRLPIWQNIFKFGRIINLNCSDDEVTNIYQVLKANKFVETDYMQQDVTELLAHLDMTDLKEIVKSFKLKVLNKKSDLIGTLVKNCSSQSTLTQVKSTNSILRERIEERMGFCIKLSKEIRDVLYKIYLLNTYPNLDFSFPTDYFGKIGGITFPSYEVQRTAVFDNQNQFSMYAQARACRNDYTNAFNKKKIMDMLKCAELAFAELKKIGEKNKSNKPSLPYFEQFLPGTQYVAILTAASSDLTRHYLYNVRQWLELLIQLNYCNHKRGFWYLQLASVQSKQRDYDLAVKTLINCLTNEKEHLNEFHLYDISMRWAILNRKSHNISRLYHDQMVSLVSKVPLDNFPSITIDSQTVRENESGRKRHYKKQLNDGSTAYLTVEQIAISHYNENGYTEGRHWEGHLICTIFCLLFWDIIYDFHVIGAFVSSVQIVPLDMYSKHFYMNRKEAIKTRLNDIQQNWPEDKLNSTLLDTWNKHKHESCLTKLNMLKEVPDALPNIVACMGRDVLSKIMKRIAKNYKDHRSGLPDLFLWNVEERICKFVEVKGEGDRLSIKQKLWLNYLTKIGAHAEVCHVHSTGSKKKANESTEKK